MVSIYNSILLCKVTLY